MLYIRCVGRKQTLVIKESDSDLEKLRKKQGSIKAEKRVLCLILLKSKRFPTQEILANHLGVSRQQLVSWLTQYRRFGLEGFLLKTTRDRKSIKISFEIHQGLSEKVKDSKNPLLGYNDAQRWVQENFNVEINYHTLRDYLKKHFNTKLKTPRKSHINKDEKAGVNFLKTS